MSPSDLTILVNEIQKTVPTGTTVSRLLEMVKSEADIFIVNGFPAQEDQILQDGDGVVLIKRGEIPAPDELEFLMTARHTPGVHQCMKKAVVAIAGLGGLGSAAAVALVRMGVGTLILADFDVVEPSNLNRQQYFLEHIGVLKTTAMKKILSAINPYVKIISHNVMLDRENIPRLFKNANVVMECFDKAEEKVMLLEAVAETLPDTYFIGASGLAGCGDSNSIVTRKMGQKIFMVGDLAKAAQPGRGLMAPRVGIAAHHQANLAVALLLDPEKAAKEVLDISE